MRSAFIMWFAVMTAAAFAAPGDSASGFPGTWEILVEGARAGSETVSSGTDALSAKGEFTYKGAKVQAEYRMTMDRLQRLTSYQALVSVSGSSARLTASVSGRTIDVKAEQAGRIVAEKSFPFDDSTVLLDNNIASHYGNLSRMLDPGGNREVFLQMIVPQAMMALRVAASLQDGAWRWTVGARSGTAARWELSSPAPQPLLILAYQDVLSREILGVEIPASRVEYRLAGAAFTPLAASAPKPAYLDASRVSEKEMLIRTGSFTMGATLTYPKGGGGRFPGVLLVSGSGPNDRDESIGGVRPMRDLAWGLAVRGFAVLRFEKRTFAYREKQQLLLPESMTIKEEFIDDAVTALRTMAVDKAVNGNRLAMIGHSLGGWALPAIHAALLGDRDRVRHMVLLAPGGVDLGETVLSQLRYRLSLSPQSDVLKALLADSEARIADLRAGRGMSGSLLGAGAAYWRDILARNPAAPAFTTSVSMLLVRGEKDFQCSESDFTSWERALAGRKNTAFTTLPRLNHLFVETEGQSTGVEYYREGYISEGLVDLIADRIR